MTRLPANTRSTAISMILRRRYGGIDAVLIWPTYPNMGIDNRNQHDMIRCMPGGIAGVRQMVDDFHRRGVHVLFPMMMWDQGTRDPGNAWPQAIAETMKEIGADGVNGDTQDGVPLAFSLAADEIWSSTCLSAGGWPERRGAGLERADLGPVQVRLRAAGRPLPLARAAAPSHISPIAGTATRRTIFSLPSSTAKAGRAGKISGASGTALPLATARPPGAWPRLSAPLRRFSCSEEWRAALSHAPVRRFCQPVAAGDNRRYGPSSIAMNTTSPGGRLPFRMRRDMRYFDLYHGTELTPEHDGRPSGFVVLDRSAWIRCRAGHPGDADAESQRLMEKMKQMTAKPLASYSHEWKPLPQQLVEIAKTEAGERCS